MRSFGGFYRTLVVSSNLESRAGAKSRTLLGAGVHGSQAARMTFDGQVDSPIGLIGQVTHARGRQVGVEIIDHAVPVHAALVSVKGGANMGEDIGLWGG